MKRILALALVTVAACGGDDGSVYQGIYDVDTWTSNDTSCDAEGDDVLADQLRTIFYLKNENFLGYKFLNLKFCMDVADCEAMAGDASTIYAGEYGFDEGSDADGWRYEYFSGFPNADDVCEGVYRVATMTGPTDDTVRIEIRDTEASGFAPDADDWCDDELGKQAAQGQPCTALEVFVATFLSELP